MNLSQLHRLLLLLGISFVLVLSSCDDDMPEPMGEEPIAAFTFQESASNSLIIEFTNTSTNANSYSWDFGDGSTSTDKDPTYEYAEAGNYTVTLTATAGAESDVATETVEVASPYRKDGYFLTSVAVSSSTTYYGGYFEDLPSGDIDLTQFQTFPLIFTRDFQGPFLYGAPTNGVDFGVAKFAVDAKSNQLVEVDRISTILNPSRVELVDEELGFFANFNELKITAFNPKTMEVIREIDLESGTPLPEAPENGSRGVSGIHYNPKTGKVICTLYYNDANTGQFYDLPDAYIAVIDVSSLSRESFDVHPEATYPIFRGDASATIDEAGNLYLIAAGSYGLDLQVGPTAATGSRPQILRVGTDSKFDLDYSWNPVNAAGFENNAFQLFTSMVSAGGTRAFGIGTGGPESPEIIELLQLLATGQITDAQFDQLRFLVFADESQRVFDIDLEAKTATIISDIPFTAGFAYPYMYQYDNVMFTQSTSGMGTYNGYYATDLNTGISTPQVNITAGGLALQLLRLSE